MRTLEDKVEGGTHSRGGSSASWPLTVLKVPAGVSLRWGPTGTQRGRESLPLRSAFQGTEQRVDLQRQSRKHPNIWHYCLKEN